MPEDQKPLVRENPLAGFFLSDLKGKVLVDFGVQGLEGENHEWGACHVAVTPGVYRLQQRFKGKLTEQTIVASPGWQTQWFGVRCHDSETMAEASIFMSPEGAGYKANNPKNRRSETGRQALARGRAPLSDELVDKLLNAKFSDPMMGLYGVHMLLQRDPSRKDLRIPVQNLRLLLGAFHPDVECLAQLAGMGNPDYVMDAPPILRRSWSLALQATVENPKLVPHGSLAEMGTARVLNREPWLLTCYREDEALEQINRDRQIQLEAKLRSYLQEATLPGRLRRRGTVHSLPRRFTESVQMADEKPSVPAQIASTVDQARKLFHTATEYVAEGLASAAGWWREKLSKDEVTQLVETLGVPRGQVEALLNRLTSIPPAKEVNRESQAVDNTPAKSE